MTRLRQWFTRAGRNTWSDWPGKAYTRAGYQQRLAAVERHLDESLLLAPVGPVLIASMCAGDGRDVVGVVQSHPRRSDVIAWLVELNGNSVAAGVAHARRAGLERTVNFLHADATSFATYGNIAPADILLVCGVWGHVPLEERASLVRACGTLCTPGGVVIWTRGVRRGTARFEAIRELFAGPAWEEIRATITPDAKWAVATHRYLGPASAPPTSGQIFHFQTVAGQ
jgi:hypothetical protein